MNDSIKEMFRLLAIAQEQAEPDEEDDHIPVLGLLFNSDGSGRLLENDTTFLTSWDTIEEGIETMREYTAPKPPRIWTREEHIPAARFARAYPELYESFLRWVERSSNYPPEAVTHFNVQFLNGVPTYYGFDALDEELIAVYQVKENSR